MAPEQSGVRLLPTGSDAFSARVALARRAERSIDVQTFLLEDDSVGRVLLREMRSAAERGVRIRLLVDDLYAARVDTLLTGFDAHPNIEVRVFNPLPLRVSSLAMRMAGSLHDFGRINRRMHNKLFIADGALALVGGRNMADDYFMVDAKSNFIDIDLIAAGPVVGDLADSFDRYWNSEAAWPLASFRGGHDSAETLRAFDAAVADAEPRLSVAGPVLDQTTVEQQMGEGRLILEPTTARVIADVPEKVMAADPGRQTAMRSLMEVVAKAHKDIVVVSPYFVPGPVGMPLMREARARGVRIRVITNSIGSTDVPLVHERYARYRREMLQLGVELYEVSATRASASRDFGDFGLSTPRLHGKAAWIDGRHVFIGSLNLSGRSSVENTEVGVLVDSPLLAGQLEYLVAQGNSRSLLQVRLAGDGQALEWVGIGAGDNVEVYASEPDSTWWLRLKLWFIAHFVPERWL